MTFALMFLIESAKIESRTNYSHVCFFERLSRLRGRPRGETGAGWRQEAVDCGFPAWANPAIQIYVQQGYRGRLELCTR